MQKLESSVESSFIGACKRRGIWQIKLGQDTMPDRMAILGDGSVVFIEVKRPRETPRPNQGKRIRKLKRHGQKVYVITTNKEAIELADKLSKANGESNRQRIKRSKSRRHGAREDARDANGASKAKKKKPKRS